MDTLSNLSAYLTLYRSETKAGFEAASVGLEEKEVANIALVFGQVCNSLGILIMETCTT